MARDICKHFDHHDEGMADDPYPLYRELRESCPIAHSDQYGGFWILSRYEDVYAAAHDVETFISGEGITIPRMGAGEAVMIPVESDPPLHGDYRKSVQQMLTPEAVRTVWGPETLEVTTELIDTFIERGEADLSEELFGIVPMTITSMMMGVALEDRPIFKQWAVNLIQMHHLDPALQAQTAHEMFTYFARQREDRRRHPRKNDVVSAITHAVIAGRPITDQEIENFCLLFMIAGIETTMSGTGAALWYLAEHPDVRQRLIDDPKLIPAAIEEFLRLFTPVQSLARTATQDVEMNGTVIPAGDPVLLLWAAGNRDPKQFPNPDEFVLNRESNLHLAFGAGPHRCLGSNLARLEMRVIIEEVLRRIPDYELTEPPRWYIGATRGIDRMPVRFTPQTSVGS